MFCALKGATFIPSSCNIRVSAATVTDLPTCDAVPSTISARFIFMSFRMPPPGRSPPSEMQSRGCSGSEDGHSLPGNSEFYIPPARLACPSRRIELDKIEEWIQEPDQWTNT